MKQGRVVEDRHKCTEISDEQRNSCIISRKHDDSPVWFDLYTVIICNNDIKFTSHSSHTIFHSFLLLGCCLETWNIYCSTGKSWISPEVSPDSKMNYYGSVLTIMTILFIIIIIWNEQQATSIRNIFPRKRIPFLSEANARKTRQTVCKIIAVCVSVCVHF